MADKSQTEMLTDYFNTLTDTQRTKALVFLFEYLQEQEMMDCYYDKDKDVFRVFDTYCGDSLVELISQ